MAMVEVDGSSHLSVNSCELGMVQFTLHSAPVSSDEMGSVDLG